MDDADMNRKERVRILKRLRGEQFNKDEEEASMKQWTRVCVRVCNYVYIGAHGSISIEGEIDLDKDHAFDKLWDNYMDGVMGNIFYICLNVFGGEIDLDKDLAFDKLWDNYMDCFYMKLKEFFFKRILEILYYFKKN
jgi:hypothetical protein